MPSRLIRDGILDSSRYWSVTIEARQLFWHIMLLADDYGCCSAAPVFLKRRCFETQPPTDHLLMLLQQLSDVDLIRQYDVTETRYLFIPRFGQRLRTMKSRYPLPPKEIIDTLLNQRLDLKSASHPPPSAAIRREVRPEVEEKGSEEKLKRSKPLALSAIALSLGSGEVIEKIPIVGKTEFEIRQSYAQELERLFPAVDIPQTLREIRAWNLSNPERRKTPRGVAKHITNWMQKVQNG